MGIQFQNDQPHLLVLKRKLLPYAFYTLLFIAIFRLCFFPSPTTLPSTPTTTTTADHLLIPKSSSPPSQEEKEERINVCDYTDGKWIHDETGPLYNSTACGTIKDGQNCASHGRPDMDYLYWRWSPNKCHLPRFDPITFLQLTRDKHVAFVGDSIARNQLESLLCLLSTVSVPNLIFTKEDNKFRKWHFASHNVNVSVYWSPFLVKGIEKSDETPYNRLYLDSVNDVWAKDLGEMDMVVLSIGHWYLHPAVFYHDEAVVGCHYCNGKNYTEVGFYDVFGMAFKTTLKALVDRKKIDVIVTTFSPAHFEGDWDSLEACSKTKPFEENERKLEGMDFEMRRQEVEQVAAAKEDAKGSKGFRLEVLDVSKLALMRPDGHPGVYMYPFPFANGKPERVPNDCVHWCLPGPVDTWNEIMLDIMKIWNN